MFPPFILTQADLGHNLAVKKKELRYPGPQCCKQTELPRGTPLAGNTFFFPSGYAYRVEKRNKEQEK